MTAQDSIPQTGLASRELARPAIIRLARAQFHAGYGFLLATGVFWIIAGGLVLALSQNYLIGLPVVLVGLAIWFGVAACWSARLRSVRRALAHGELTEGMITKVFDRATGSYRPYADVAGEWSKFVEAANLDDSVIDLSKPLRNFRVKISLASDGGEEMEARMNLGERILDSSPDAARVRIFVSREGGVHSVVAIDDYPWLKLNESGEFEDGSNDSASDATMVGSLLKSVLVVVPTYVLVVIGMTYGGGDQPEYGGSNELPFLVGLVFVLVFTVSHAVLPVFFYSTFFRKIKSVTRRSSRRGVLASLRFGPVLGLVHMVGWYSMPILVLAFMAGWYNIAWVLVCVIIAGNGKRKWAFIEHGSTSMALLLYLFCFSEAHLFPMGIMVVLIQSLLLTLADWKGKKLWVGDDAQPTT